MAPNREAQESKERQRKRRRKKRWRRHQSCDPSSNSSFVKQFFPGTFGVWFRLGTAFCASACGMSPRNGDKNARNRSKFEFSDRECEGSFLRLRSSSRSWPWPWSAKFILRKQCIQFSFTEKSSLFGQFTAAFDTGVHYFIPQVGRDSTCHKFSLRTIWRYIR